MEPLICNRLDADLMSQNAGARAFGLLFRPRTPKIPTERLQSELFHHQLRPVECIEVCYRKLTPAELGIHGVLQRSARRVSLYEMVDIRPKPTLTVEISPNTTDILLHSNNVWTTYLKRPGTG